MVSGQNHVLAEFRRQLSDSRCHVTWVLNSVVTSADSAKKSIDLWNREMRQVQWTYLGLMLLIGALLGALLYWWVVSPKNVVPPQQVSRIRQAQPSAALQGKTNWYVPK